MKINYSKINPCPICGTGTKGCGSFDDKWFNCRGRDNHSYVPGFVHHKDCGNGFHTWRREVDDLQSHFERTDRSLDRKVFGGPAPVKSEEQIKKEAETQRQKERNSRKFAARLEHRRPMDADELAWACRYYGGFSPATLAAFDVQIFISDSSRIDLVPAEPVGKYPSGAMVEHIWLERDAAGEVIGICHRQQHKDNVVGEKKNDKPNLGRRGIYFPLGFDWNAHDTIFVVEGGSDTAAMFDAGLAAIGRPSNVGGSQLISEFLTRNNLTGKNIVIVAESDQHIDSSGKDVFPGFTGAVSTSSAFVAAGIPSTIAFPPDGFKDVREAITAARRRGIPAHEYGKVLAAHLTSTAKKAVQAVLNPTSVSPASPSVGTDGASESGRPLYTPIAVEFRACNTRPKPSPTDSHGTPESSYIPAHGFCPNPNRSEYRNEIDGRRAIWLHPCRRNDCPCCGEKNRDQKSATVSYWLQAHEQQCVERNTTSDLHFFRVHKDDWEVVSAALRKTRKKGEARTEYFCLGDDDPAAASETDVYTVVSTRKPASRKITDHEVINPGEALTRLLTIIESWADIRQDFWSSSRGWKLIGDDKKKSDKWAGWTRVCGIRTSIATIMNILNHHNIDMEILTMRGAFWSWKMWIFQNSAKLEAAFEDIYAGEVRAADDTIDVQSFFDRMMNDIAGGTVHSGSPPPAYSEWN